MRASPRLCAASTCSNVPTSGKIVVDGQDVTGLSGAALRAYRRRVAMIFQNFGLLAQKTVIDNVLLSLQGGDGARYG